MALFRTDDLIVQRLFICQGLRVSQPVEEQIQYLKTNARTLIVNILKITVRFYTMKCCTGYTHELFSNPT